MYTEEGLKGRGACRVRFKGIKIEISRFTGIKTDFSRITQNSAFDFICRPYSIAKLLNITYTKNNCFHALNF